MTHFLDSLPFDWTNPGAQELRDLLAGEFFRVDQVVFILQQAGIAPAAIALERPVHQVWHSAIERARPRTGCDGFSTRPPNSGARPSHSGSRS